MWIILFILQVVLQHCESNNTTITGVSTSLSNDDIIFAFPQFDGSSYSNPASFTNWTGVPGPIAIFQWTFLEEDNGTFPDAKVLDATVPIHPLKSFSSPSDLYASWLGHGTIMVHIEGARLITDPVWCDHAFVVNFAGPKRHRPPPINISDLPELDFGFISHDHYDHLDEGSVKEIASRFPSMRWFVPMGIGDFMKDAGITNTDSFTDRVVEMTWGQSHNVTLNGKVFQIWCVPAQHWGQRFAFDRNKRLWAGWVVLGPTKRFYYTGDTGYVEPEFKKIGDKFGPFDLAAIQIGCFEPRWFMRAQHTNIDESIMIHLLVRSKLSIGIHWGTYDMGSNENYLWPKEWLQLATKNLSISNFITIEQGAIWEENNPLQFRIT